MNTRPINDAVVQHWKEKAGYRQTVVLCSAVDHARDAMASFQSPGIAIGMIWGDMSQTEHPGTLDAHGKGEPQVIVNVAVLTEAQATRQPPASFSCASALTNQQ